MANRFVDATLRLVDKFSSPLSKATAEMQAKGRQIQKTANSIKRTGKNLESVGTSLEKKVTVPIIGIMAVGSAQKSMQGKQIFGVILGLLVMLLFSVIDYKWILRFYWILYAVNLILLLLVHFFGAEANNAVRWLDFGFIRFQPSDPTKILMILFFAQFLTKHRKKLNHPVMIMEAIA